MSSFGPGAADSRTAVRGKEYQDLRKAIREMEEKLRALCAAEQPSMQEGLLRIINAGGKRLRPAVAWICYRFGTDPKFPILPLMCMLELTHTASLIHDDLVDDAPIRRGVQTIHETDGRRTAVNCGDLLLARVMKLMPAYQGTGINEVIAGIAMQMCSGEFMQIRHRFQLQKQTVASYYAQIRQKTAFLISASCYTGAMAGGLPEEQQKALRDYGEQIGIAFQMRDDILDFASGEQFGKKHGQDVRSGIFTLPVLKAVRDNPDPEMMDLLEKRDKTDDEVRQVIEYVQASDGIKYTKEQAALHTSQAVALLDALPDCASRKMLMKLAGWLEERTT